MSVQADYQNDPMTRARACDIMIAFALTFDLPIRRRASADGAGYDAIVPMEFLTWNPEVKAMLDSLDR